MELKMPDLGEGVTEGEISKWLVKEGEELQEDQVVLEVMTDKATVEIPTIHAGKLVEIVAKEGHTVPVGSVLAHIGSATSSKKKKSPSAETPVLEQVLQPRKQFLHANHFHQVQASPLVRRIAQEKNMDISQIKGSGPHGRILLQDLLAKKGAKQSQREAVDSFPLRGLRKQIVKKMAESKKNAAHFTCVEEADATELLALRKSLKGQFESLGVKLSYMPFIIKAAYLALKKFPSMNASLEMQNETDGNIVQKKYYNFGIAVDTEQGLTVPIIQAVDKLDLLGLAKKINDISSRARSNKLGAEDFENGTFTITNAGKVGGLFATPIINYPEVSILGVHEIRKRPMVVNNEIKIRDTLYLSVSIDHRVVDGATGIRFLDELRKQVEEPKNFIPKKNVNKREIDNE